MKVNKALITAAGWGTRFLPITKSQPKEMLPLMNKPLIQHTVEEAVACGAELVVIVTSAGKRAIEDHFDRSLELERVLEQKGENGLAEDIRRLSRMADICYIRQRQQLGLGHAVLTAESVIGDNPFILLLPDDLFEQGEQVLKQMLDISGSCEGSVIAVKRVAQEDVSRYGIIESKQVAEHVYQVTDLVEKPQAGQAPSDMAIMGRYVLTPDIFPALDEVTPGKNGEIQLTDALRQMLRKHPVYAYEIQGEYYDAGTPLGWLETTIALALNDRDTGPRMRERLEIMLRHAPQLSHATA